MAVVVLTTIESRDRKLAVVPLVDALSLSPSSVRSVYSQRSNVSAEKRSTKTQLNAFRNERTSFDDGDESKKFLGFKRDL
jgi:hypothetical protein